MHFAFKNTHYAINVGRGSNQGTVRTTVRLPGYITNALMEKHGLPDDGAVRRWIEAAVNADGRYDPHYSLTRQAMRLIVESLV